jgi:3',5'-cyclic AMP phosphodiesterase CpdA
MKKIVIIFSLLLFAGALFAQDFWFVQISDTHLGYKNHRKKTEKLIESINELPFDIKAVVHTGDVFQNNIAKPKVVSDYHELVKQIKAPYYVVAGNHDLLPWEYANDSETFISEVGPLNQIINIESVNFVFYYSMPLADTRLPDYEKQKEWITHTLDSLKDEQVLVFHHQPSVMDFYNNKEHDSWPKAEREFWSDILNKDNVEAVICGHFHRDELHWLGNVPVYVASSIAGFWGRQASYRIYHYQNEKLSYKTVYLND